MPKQKYIALTDADLQQTLSDGERVAQCIRDETPAIIASIEHFAETHLPGEDSGELQAAIRELRNKMAKWTSDEAPHVFAAVLDSHVIAEAKKHEQTPEEWLSGSPDIPPGMTDDEARLEYLKQGHLSEYLEVMRAVMDGYFKEFANRIDLKNDLPSSSSVKVLVKCAEVEGLTGIQKFLFGENPDAIISAVDFREIFDRVDQEKRMRTLQ